jgi:hypothetical protein
MRIPSDPGGKVIGHFPVAPLILKKSGKLNAQRFLAGTIPLRSGGEDLVQPGISRGVIAGANQAPGVTGLQIGIAGILDRHGFGELECQILLPGPLKHPDTIGQPGFLSVQVSLLAQVNLLQNVAERDDLISLQRLLRLINQVLGQEEVVGASIRVVGFRKRRSLGKKLFAQLFVLAAR